MRIRRTIPDLTSRAVRHTFNLAQQKRSSSREFLACGTAFGLWSSVAFGRRTHLCLRTSGGRWRERFGPVSVLIHEKGKPVARPGRKAMGPDNLGIARLPKGCWTPKPALRGNSGRLSHFVGARRYVTVIPGFFQVPSQAAAGRTRPTSHPAKSTITCASKLG